jgi:hypothetical protein
MTQIIAIGHRKGTGKDTFGSMLEHELVTAYGARVERTSFARALKDIVSILFEPPASSLFGRSELRDAYLPPSVRSHAEGVLGRPVSTTRELLQIFGTDIMRKNMPNIWVDAVLKKRRRPAPDFLIVTDTRFKNETLATLEQGGITVKVDRAGVPSDTHDSEHDLDDWAWDFTIENNSDLTTLRVAANSLAQYLTQS